MRNLASLSPDHCHSAASVPLVFWSVRDDCPRFCTVCATYLCATLHARHQPHAINRTPIYPYTLSTTTASHATLHRSPRRLSGGSNPGHFSDITESAGVLRDSISQDRDEYGGLAEVGLFGPVMKTNKQTKTIFHCTMKFCRVECARVHHHVPTRLPHHTPSNVDGSSSTFW